MKRLCSIFSAVFSVAVLGSVLCLEAFAASPQEIRTERTLTLRSGSHSFQLLQYTNEFGGREVHVEHQEARRFLPDTRAIVLWGRDTDRDNRFDAWFFHGESGVIEAIDFPSYESDGWDAASLVLKHQVQLENRWMSTVVFSSLANTFTLTRTKQNDFWRKLTRDQMNFRDLEIRANRMYQRNRAAPGLTELYTVISDGWAEMAGDGVGTALKQNFLFAASDIGLYITGAALIRSLAVGGKWAVGQVMGSASGEFIQSLYAKYFQGIVAQADRAWNQAQAKKEAISAVVGRTALVANAAAAKASATAQAKMMLTQLEARGAIGKFAAERLQEAYGVGAALKKRLPYMTAVQSTQILAEVANRPEDLFSWNPIVLAGNLKGDENFMQNFMFMGRETILLATVSELDSNVKRSMVICGVLSMTNSGITTYMYNDGNLDRGRVAIDTGWEVIIGNGQTQVDIRSMKYLEALAEKTKNPRYVLVGWAIVLVNQSVGYYGFSKLTEWYESRGEPLEAKPMIQPDSLRLVPLMVPVEATRASSSR